MQSPVVRSEDAAEKIVQATLALDKKFDRSVSLLTWGYNEEELVQSFLDRAFDLLRRTAHDFEIVFVNDASTDGTGEILEQYAAGEPRLRVITHARNLNVGMACRTAVQNATKEVLFWQTVDWSYDLRNLRIFLELLNYFDVVQGVRPTPERLLSHIPGIRSVYRAKTRSDNIRKAIISLSNYYLLRILYGAHFHDFQNVTFYPRRLVQSLGLRGKTSFVNPELLIKTYHAGATFLEVPIHFIPRTGGTAKGTKLTTVIRSAVDVIGNAISWGWKGRSIHETRESAPRIFRVSEPFFLEEKVLYLVVPLLKDFR
ncbi:MAG TPA: glycosyltransferase family 2 protein [Desulfomonilaceae bacterium]|nr:glycosyltransferase family 2 protein [Desulfomonilaceae bacterium]